MGNKPPRVKLLQPRIREQPLRQIGSLSWRAGKTTNARGYTYRWQQARARFLRANPLCAYCLRDRRPVPATVVDHIIPHEGDMDRFWDEANWQPLCKTCHDTVKAQEERRGGNGPTR